MINEIIAQKIISKCPQPWKNYEVVSLTDCSHGCDQQVKIATLKNKKGSCRVIIKYPKQQPDKIMHEKIGCQCSESTGVPVPKIIYYDDKYLVETFVQGKILIKFKGSNRKFKDVYRKLGHYLKCIHANRGTQFGKIKNYSVLKGQHKDKQHLREAITYELGKLQQYYDKAFLAPIKQYIKENQDIINKKENQTSLLHGDYTEDNILANQKQVTAIIDFGDLAMGNPMEDFARLFVSHHSTYKWESILQGYGDHNLREIKFYTVVLCLWQLNLFIEKQKFRGRIRQLEKTIKVIAI